MNREKEFIRLRDDIYNQIPHDTPLFFITINLPYSLKTYDLCRFTTLMRYLLSKFEKHLQGGATSWINHPYMFYAFYENNKGKEPWHIHILAPFINPITNTQLSLNFVERCFERANNIFKRHTKRNRGVDYDIQLVPYSNTRNTINYCTKELYFDGTLHTERIYTPETLFYKHKTKKRARTRLPKPIRKMRAPEDLIQILSIKYTIQREKHK